MNELVEISFEASEDWSVEDFYNFFHQLNILYNRLYVLEKIRDKQRSLEQKNSLTKPRKLESAFIKSLSAVKDKERLFIKSIELHSPGDFNLLGVDKIIYQLRELWKDISYRNKQESKQGEESQRHRATMNHLNP